MTPVGPLSLDYGFKIDRRPDESIGEIHFSISGTF
jgi:outer membrane protein assembly factor BamA